MTILWKCDIPVSMVSVFWKLRGRFLRKISIDDGYISIDG